jgi:dephospho-CoA kinase
VVRRIKNRNNWSEEQIRGRIRSQFSHEERARHAQVIIDTNCPMEEVRRRVKAQWDARNSAKG